MKRYVCTVATGLLLALVSTGTATATLLPLPGLVDQSATQETSFGDQTVGEQKNEASVTQAQGNGNLNIAPAIAIFGDAETTNKQGNDNTATTTVGQSNTADQEQSSVQKQSLDQSGAGCCDGQSQIAEQTVYGGDQTVGEQRNDAAVEQWQGNGNVNVAPAIALFGDAESTNYQGNGNEADATVTQSNTANQSQSSVQKQYLDQDGGGCCKPSYGCKPSDPCAPKKDQRWEKERCCKDGSSQTAEQTADFGNQTIGEQRNEASVTQKQGNGNVSLAPALAFGKGKGKGNSCYSKCGKPSYHSVGGNAETTNKQGNGNDANAQVGQSNTANQAQTSYQHQNVVDLCKGLIHH
ncbi:MAG: hypothetical protein ACRDPX_13400 [Gaiellaceae bacterium]